MEICLNSRNHDMKQLETSTAEMKQLETSAADMKQLETYTANMKKHPCKYAQKAGNKHC
jgi:hypothetical protein